MADKYLDFDNGNDDNDGNDPVDQGGGVGPWKTFDKALSATGVSSGDVCHVADGTYRENTGGTFNYLRATQAYTSETTFRAATEGSTGVIVTTSGSGTPIYNADFVATNNLTLIDITFRLTDSNPTTNVRIYGTTTNFKMVRCKTVRGDQTQNHGGFWKPSSAGNGSGYTFVNCKFEGYGTGKSALYIAGATGNLTDDVVVRNCHGSGASYGLRATYVSNLKVYKSWFVGTTGGNGIKCGNLDPAVDEGMDGLRIYDTHAENLLTSTDAAIFGGGCNSPIIEGCSFVGGRYSLVDSSDGATFRSCLCDVNQTTGAYIPLNLYGTNSRVGNASTYDNCTFIGTASNYGIYAPVQGAGQATKVTFTNCAIWAYECFGPHVLNHWGTTLFTNGVYGPSEGNSPPTITASVNAIPEIDAMSIPVARGNCDIGKGVVGKRTLGQLDLYGRTVLRGDADSIGAVYPQRHDPRNILQPVVQYAAEMVA